MRKSTVGYEMPNEGGWVMREGWTMPDQPCVQGHAWPRNRFGQCIKCVREYRATRGHFRNTPAAAEWRGKNKDRLNALRDSWLKRRPDKKMIANARRSAGSKGVPFNLAPGDFDLPKVCPVLGMTLDYSLGTRHAATASLDRITPKFGYVKGNVIVVSWRANKIKCDATIDELERVARFYKQLKQMVLT